MFFGGTNSQQSLVKQAADDWLNRGLGKAFELNYIDSPDKSHIKIGFNPDDGNWSYVGKNCLDFGPSDPTMNIADPYPHVCKHEWGHTWCLQHEHQFPGGIQWIDTEVIKDAKALWGWSEKKTRDNILTQFPKSAVCIGGPDFNKTSIMLYPVRSNWNSAGFSSGNITQINPRDISCLKAMYNI